MLLARADKQRVERSSDFETMIFELFDIDVDAEHDLPVAPVTRALHQHRCRIDGSGQVGQTSDIEQPIFGCIKCVVL